MFRFLDHIKLDERAEGFLWNERSATRRGSYLHNTQQTQETKPLPSGGFEAAIPVIKRFQTYALDRTATGIGHLEKTVIEFHDQSLESL